MNGKDLISRIMSFLNKEYLINNESKISKGNAWLIVGIFAGLLSAVILIANTSVEFNVSKADYVCGYYNEEVPVDYSLWDQYGCGWYSFSDIPDYCYEVVQVPIYCPDSSVPVTSTTQATVISDPVQDYNINIFTDGLDMDEVLVDPTKFIDNIASAFGESGTNLIENISSALFQTCVDCVGDPMEAIVNNTIKDSTAAVQSDVDDMLDFSPPSEVEKNAIDLALQESGGDDNAAVDNVKGYDENPIIADLGYNPYDSEQESMGQSEQTAFTNKLNGVSFTDEGALSEVNGGQIKFSVDAANNVSFDFNALRKLIDQALNDNFSDTARASLTASKVLIMDSKELNDLLEESAPDWVQEQRAMFLQLLDGGFKNGQYTQTQYDAIKANIQTWPIMMIGGVDALCACGTIPGLEGLIVVGVTPAFTEEMLVPVIYHEFVHQLLYNKYSVPTSPNITGLYSMLMSIPLPARNNYFPSFGNYYAARNPAEFAATIAQLSSEDSSFWGTWTDSNFVGGQIYQALYSEFIKEGILKPTIADILRSVWDKGLFATVKGLIWPESYSPQKSFADSGTTRQTASVFSSVINPVSAASVNQISLAVTGLHVTSDTLKQTAENAAKTAVNGAIGYAKLALPDADRNLYVDYITVNGVKYEAEDSSVYSTGSIDPANGACLPGNRSTEILSCNGYFEFNVSMPMAATTIVISAKGTPVSGTYPSMQIRSGDKSLKSWTVKSTYANFTYSSSSVPPAGKIRIAFTNDAVKPDLNSVRAKTLTPQAQYLISRKDDFTEMQSLLESFASSLTTGKTASGVQMMTKNFETLLQGSFNAAQGRVEFMNNSADTNITPFIKLSDSLKSAESQFSKHAARTSGLFEEITPIAGSAGAKTKIVSDLNSNMTRLHTIFHDAQLYSQLTDDDRNFAGKMNDLILQAYKANSSGPLATQLKALVDDAGAVLIKSINATKSADANKSVIRAAVDSVNLFFPEADALRKTIATQAAQVSTQTNKVLADEANFLSQANSSLAVANSNAAKSLTQTSISGALSYITTTATQVGVVAQKMDGVFSSTDTSSFHKAFTTLATDSVVLSGLKNQFSNSLNVWASPSQKCNSFGLNCTTYPPMNDRVQEVENNVIKAQASFGLIVQASIDADEAANKIDQDYVMVLNLLGTPPNVITVRAKGISAGGIYPKIRLQIGDSKIQSWIMTDNFADYKVSTARTLDGVKLKVFFENAETISGVKRTAIIDSISVNGATYQSEDPSVYATGAFNPGKNKCAPGNLSTETLICRGSLQFTLPSPAPGVI